MWQSEVAQTAHLCRLFIIVQQCGNVKCFLGMAGAAESMQQQARGDLILASPVPAPLCQLQCVRLGAAAIVRGCDGLFTDDQAPAQALRMSA